MVLKWYQVDFTYKCVGVLNLRLYLFLKHVFTATRLDWLLFNIGLDLALCDLLVHGSISHREAKKLGLSCLC